jgi:hypothetical protein
MASTTQDGWDWPYILYVGRKWLGYTDEQVWRLTPKQFASQVSVHENVIKQMHGVDGSKTDAPSGFIDQIPGW